MKSPYDDDPAREKLTALGENPAINFIGLKQFGGHAGAQLYEKLKSDTRIYGDVNGDRRADFAIHLDEGVTLAKGYFLL